jgi:hypothetical protein
MSMRGLRMIGASSRREALFASGLQPSDAPTAEVAAEAIAATMRRFGSQGCAGRMAQEFGDHPDAAAERMRWIIRLTARAGLGSADLRRRTKSLEDERHFCLDGGGGGLDPVIEGPQLGQ